MRRDGRQVMRAGAVLAGLMSLGGWGGALGAQAAPARGAAASADTLGPRLYSLIEIGVARSLPATLADHYVTGAVTAAGGAATQRESLRLRLDGQWGIIAELRKALGARRVWGVEAYGARFRGRARLGAARQVVVTSLGGAGTTDSVNYRLGGVTTWRLSLAGVRAFPLPATLTGAALLGATYGKVTSPAPTCASAAAGCPKLDLTTPGVTAGVEAFTRPWRKIIRLRFAVKGDAMHVDEAEVRRSLHWAPFAAAPLGEGDAKWRVLPSGTIGIEFRLRKER